MKVLLHVAVAIAAIVGMGRFHPSDSRSTGGVVGRQESFARCQGIGIVAVG